MKILLSTLVALAKPRRIVPLLLTCAAILATEWVVTRSALALVVDTMLLACFVVVAPGAWRLLLSDPGAPVPRVIRMFSYVGICSVVVGVVGLLVPIALNLKGTYVSDPPALGIVTVLFAVGGWGLGRDIDLEAGLEAEKLRADRLAFEVEHAQLLALRNHLDPHFLFNTLSAIAEWCREDPVVAERACLELASLLRDLLQAVHAPSWSLEHELGLLKRLFHLYEVRDNERYRLVLEVPDRLPDLMVPAMVLLPLFENAITHGPMAGHEGVVRLIVQQDNGEVCVEIRNPGPFTGRRAGGHGIELAERRLRSCFDGHAGLTLASSDGETCATITFPQSVTHDKLPT